MSAADDLLRAGDLAGARAALVAIVRSQPADEKARMFLFQLLAVSGEWDKARAQLQALAQLSPEAQMLAVAYGQAIDAEKVRTAVFSGAVLADVLAHSDGWAAGLAEANQLLAQDQISAGITQRDAVFDQAPDCPGRFNGIGFDWIADSDSRFGPALEAIIAGRYGLLPLEAVQSIKSDGPVDLRDLVWFPVQIAFKSGQSVAGFLPVRYPGSENSAESAEQLARATGWSETAWGQAGLGQRLLTLSDGEEHGLLTLRHLEFD